MLLKKKTTKNWSNHLFLSALSDLLPQRCVYPTHLYLHLSSVVSMWAIWVRSPVRWLASRIKAVCLADKAPALSTRLVSCDTPFSRRWGFIPSPPLFRRNRVISWGEADSSFFLLVGYPPWIRETGDVAMNTVLGIGFGLFVVYAIWHGIYLARHYKDGGFLLEKRLKDY